MILLAEDNNDDAMLLERACRKAQFEHKFRRVANGADAIEYLKRCLRKENPNPCVVLLDIKMPKVDGFEVLAWMRSHAEFSAVPAIMLSTSSLQVDMDQAKRLGASAYYTKPFKFEDMVLLMQEIERKWINKDNPDCHESAQ